MLLNNDSKHEKQEKDIAVVLDIPYSRRGKPGRSLREKNYSLKSNLL